MKQPYLLSCINLVLCTSLFSASPGDPAWNLAANNLLLYEDIQSKVCNVAITDLSGVYTSIESLEQTTLANDSKIDVLASALDDLISTQTAFNGALQNACDVEQYMQSAYDHIVNAKEGFGQYISAADIGTTGYTISQPGKYILCESVNFAPGATGRNAITINSDNVTLDLNGFSLIQTNATATTDGISINSAFSNVTILNGLIKNFTQYGIEISSGDSNIFINDVWIENPDTGIQATSADNINILNTTITNAGRYGISFDGCTESIIYQSNSFVHAIAGIRFVNAIQKNTLQKCSCHGGIAGFSIQNGNEIIIKQCFAAQNSTSGIYVEDSRNILIQENFLVENGQEGIEIRQITGTATQIKIIGNILISNTQRGIYLNNSSNCFVFENIALLTTNSGFNQNIDEQFGGPNSILGNWALGAVAGDNYGSSTSTINSVVINQNGTFPSEPTKWQNISMTT